MMVRHKCITKVTFLNRKLTLMKKDGIFSLGQPIAGTGAGLRPIGQDPNFANDLREIFNISYPIRSEAEEDLIFSRDSYSGNGRNKWPSPELVSENWKATVSKIFLTFFGAFSATFFFLNAAIKKRENFSLHFACFFL